MLLTTGIFSVDYLKKYRSFLYSHYFSAGLRITAGVILPALIMGYFDLLSAGVAISLGAMCVSATDNPGPIHHRRNGMLVCTALVFLMALITGFVNPYPILLGAVIVASCFVFSMIGVYGMRANSIGLAALLVMVLSLGKPQDPWQLIIQSGYILGGGLWYTGLSLLLYGFRPYLLAQQALGECIETTAEYLRIRASFYEAGVDHEKTYRQMVEQQVLVQHQQDLVRELLFKSRDITRETTLTGRTLLMLFSTVADLFERIMTSYTDYRELHTSFDDTAILQQYRRVILHMAQELDDISLAVKSGRSSHEDDTLPAAVKETWQQFTALRDEKRTASNLEQFITLRHILENIEDITGLIHTLHLYTAHDKQLPQQSQVSEEYDKFVTHQDYSIKLLKDNLSLKSNYFRHAIRVSIASIAGYIIAELLNLGHGYWILLTIIVILKPAYSLTRKRNYERLLGTIGGALLGILILYVVKDRTALFIIMLVLMVATYSLLRTRNYLVSVILMTPYVLLIFHFLYSGPLKTVIVDRLVDTGIGSVIAFIGNFLLAPVWEHEQIREYMITAIENNMQYFKDIAAAFTGKAVPVTQYKLSRKGAFVALANLSDGLTRMLSEPKRRQKNLASVHEFVVASHLITSHIATLSDYAQQWAGKYSSGEFVPVINDTLHQLETARTLLKEKAEPAAGTNAVSWKRMQEQVNTLMEKRRAELQQGLPETGTRKELFEFKSIADQFTFVNRLSADCRKISGQMKDL